jgi:hypothetical protein
MKDPQMVRCADLVHGVTQIRWDGYVWTAWAPAPAEMFGPAHWWLVRVVDGVKHEAAVACRDMAYVSEQLSMFDE